MLCGCFIYAKFNLRVSVFLHDLVWYGGHKTGRFTSVVVGMCLSWIKFFLVFLLKKWVGFSLNCLILLMVNFCCWAMGKAGGFDPLTITRGQISVCSCAALCNEVFLGRISLRVVCCSLGKADNWGESNMRRSAPSLSSFFCVGVWLLSYTAFRRSLNLMSWPGKGLLEIILFFTRDRGGTLLVLGIACMFEKGDFLFAGVDRDFSWRHGFLVSVKSSKLFWFFWDSESGW